MALLGTLSRSFGRSANGGLSSSVAMSLGRSLGRSWTRENFLDVALQLYQRSPMLVPSPSRDLAQFAVLEDKFCKDFKCCGNSLENLHDLLHHFEECHVRVDSEFGDDDDLPFDFMDEDMDQSDDAQDHNLASSSSDDGFRPPANLSFADIAFLKAQVASMDRRDVIDKKEPIPPVQLPATVVNAPLQQLSLRGRNHDPSSSSSAINGTNHVTASATPSTLLAPFRQSTADATPVTMSDIYLNSSRNRRIGGAFAHSQVPKNDHPSAFTKLEKPIQSHHQDGPHDMEMDDVVFPAGPSGPDHPHHHHRGASDDEFADDEDIGVQRFAPSSNAWTAVQGRSLSIGKPPSSAAAMAAGRGYGNALGRPAAEDRPVTPASFIRKSLSGPSRKGSSSSAASTFAIPKESREETIRRQLSLGVSSLNPAGSGGGLSTSPDAAEKKVKEEVAMKASGNDSDDGGGNGSGGGGAKEDRPYRCRVEGCAKAYKNPGGLKYHMLHGHAEDTGDPEINNIIQKPYLCPVAACEKRYKNLNGLKYHIEHAHSALVENV
ncbi:Transcriptional regulator of ribosomal biogenesis proteins [Dinochytrium kinnereticum]|nr:Transcriptional regulator of ribosomal biogenesis proteins [Dinochytrium kinnereticum]